MPPDICHILFNTIAKLPPVYHELRSLSLAGVETAVYEVANDDEPNAAPLSLPHLSLTRARILLRRLSTRQSRAWKLARFAEYMVRVFFFVLRTRCTIVVAHDLPAAIPSWLAARLSRKRIVYNAHELWGESNGITAPFPAFWRTLDRFLCPRVDALITPEENRARIYRDEYGARTTTLVIPNAPPYRSPEASSVLSDFLAAQGILPDMIVLYQGIFDESRCLHELIEAMVHTDEGIVLVLAGRGSDEQRRKLEVAISQRGLSGRVVFHPFVHYESLHRFTSSADVGVLFYRNDCRNNMYCAPNKLYEYAQAGLPVLASDNPGVADVIRARGMGLVVDATYPETITEGLNLLKDPQRRAAMTAHALDAAQNDFQWEHGFVRLLKLYTDLTGQFGAADFSKTDP
ncbi:MAG: glycosyltransferase [Ignavibacteriae bacterium]|nr:glycosyltransferase [Ignavibacteriota bacterium]